MCFFVHNEYCDGIIFQFIPSCSFHLTISIQAENLSKKANCAHTELVCTQKQFLNYGDITTIEFVMQLLPCV